MELLKRDWTVLFYLNGNNELDPQMRRAEGKIESVGCLLNAHIVVQIACSGSGILRLIRPHHPIQLNKESYMRRYRLESSGKIPIKKWKRINLANPRHLYAFVKWGFQNYPATHYIVILSGHGAPILGMMADFSQRNPFVMGIPEMCAAVKRACTETGQTIDLLILDMCHMNYVELLYELAQKNPPPVQYLMTYIQEGPLSGLPYDKLLQLLQSASTYDLETIIAQLLKKLHEPMVCCKIDCERLLQIKQLANVLAFRYLRLKKLVKYQDKAGIYQLGLQSRDLVAELELTMNALIEGSNGGDESVGKLLEMAGGELKEEIYFKEYGRWAFAKNNFWYNRWSQKDAKERSYKIKLKPKAMSPEMVRAYLKAANPELSDDAIEAVYQKFHRMKRCRGLFSRTSR